MKNKKAFRVLLIGIILLLCFLLNGCYDMKELDNRAFVLAYGIEKGKSNDIRMTVMIASPKKLSGSGSQGGGGGDEQKGIVVTSLEAPTVPIAINLMNTYIGRTLYFGHAGFVFYSEEFVRKGDENLLIAPERFRELRRDASIFIVRGEVKDFINQIRPLIAANPVKYLRQIVESYNNTGYIPNSVLYKFFADIENYKVDASLPLCSLNKVGIEKEDNQGSNLNTNKFIHNFKAGELIREGGLPIEFLGSAIFKGNKMIGTISGYETRLYNLIRGNLQTGYFDFPDIDNPKYLETVLIKRGKTPTVKVDISHIKPKIKMTISLDGDLISTAGYTNYSINKNILALEEKIENILSSESNALVKKMQKQNSDIFGLGFDVAKKFWTWDDFTKYHWLKEKFKTAEIDIKYSYHIRRIGFQEGSIKPAD